jgi:hypothetical protein
MKTRTAHHLRLNQALHGLRDDAETAIQHYALRTQAALAEMITRLNAAQEPQLPARATKALLACFQNLTIKPKKGRAKDLKRIETLIEKITAALEPPA